MTKMQIHRNVEDFMYSLLKWADDNQSNDAVSDNLYKEVHNITCEVIDDLDEIERDIINAY